jgi:hypothetical protein
LAARFRSGSFAPDPTLAPFLKYLHARPPPLWQVRSLLRDHFDGKEPNCAVSPEEAVAHGTAIQAAILTDRKRISVGATEASLHAHLAAGLER